MTQDREATWTYLTNHSHVLVCLARDPRMRLRDVADAVGITERSVQAIVSDLEAAGALIRQRVGRRNHYTVVTDSPLRHRVEAGHVVGDLLDALGLEPANGRPLEEAVRAEG